MRVRSITADDIDDVVALGAKMHAESMLAQWPLNTERARLLLETVHELPDVFAFVAVDEDRIVGALIGELTCHMVIDVMIAGDHLLYVERGSRGSKAAARLIGGFEAWAKLRDADLVKVQVDAGIANDRAVKFLWHLKYEDRGTSMIKGL